jgi:hypothetical protein
MTLLGRIAQAITGKIQFVVNEEKHLLIVPVIKESIHHNLLIQVNEEAETIVLILKYQTKAPQDRQEEICVFLSGLNQIMMVGGLEMNSSDGECQYRYTVNVESIQLNDQYLERLVMEHIDKGFRFWHWLEPIMNGATSESILSQLTS